MSNLFLDGIFGSNPEKNDSPSAIFITMPNIPSGSFCAPWIITGLMAGDPTWSVGNKWGPIINDLSNLQDWASLIGTESQVSWINASTMCWKGTNPLNLSVDFFLINYAPDLGLEDKLAMLNKLAAIDRKEGSDMIVRVHGGYAADVLTGNSGMKLFDRKPIIGDLEKGKQGGVSNALKGVEAGLFSDGSDAKGSITIKFGHKTKISNLLVSKISVTESTIEVANSSGGNQKPLYYRVSAQFTGVRPLITTDVDRMFGKSNGGGVAPAPEPSGISQTIEKAAEYAVAHPYKAGMAMIAGSFVGGPFAPLIQAAGATLIGVADTTKVKNMYNKFIGK